MSASWPPPQGTWVIDLDGVIWLTGHPIDGGASAIDAIRSQGSRALFVTNNSAPTVADLRARLRSSGIDATPDEIVTSAQSAATMVEPGATALVVGERGVHEALADRGVAIADVDSPDVVVVGWDRGFTFDRLAGAMTAVRKGARLIGTNEDPTYPTPDGLLPGSGSLLAAVATASGTAAEVAGKPHPPIVELVRARAEHPVVAVVGDRPSTDGRLAAALGAAFALVLSGVTSAGDDHGRPPPAVVAPDLRALANSAATR